MGKTSTDFGAGAPANWGLRGEQRFRSILVNAADPIICTNARGKVVFSNRAAQELFGYDSQELCGKELLTLMPSCYRDRHSQALAGYMATRMRTGPDHHLEAHGLHKNGTEFPIELAISAFETESGTIFSASIHDLGLRRKSAHQQSDSRFFRALSGLTKDAVFVLDENANVLECNPAAALLLGCAGPESIVGRAFHDYFLAVDIGRIDQCFSRAALRDDCSGLRMRSQNESLTLVDLSLARIDSEDGVRRTIATINDRTASEKAQHEQQDHEERLQRTLRGTVSALAATVEIRDPYIAGHQQRVSELSLAIALDMGLPRERAEGLRVAAMLHDIGKIYVPPDTLSKSDTLSDFEIRVVQAHAQAGYDLLKDIDFPWPVATTIMQHHERLDGTGYPEGLIGKIILLEARILAVADVVEAMSSERPHRHAYGMDEVLAKMGEESGRAYDENVVSICRTLFESDRFEFGARQTALPSITFNHHKSA